jgi:hypothetical protein
LLSLVRPTADTTRTAVPLSANRLRWPIVALLEQALECGWDRPDGPDGITVASLGGKPYLIARRRYPFRRYFPLREESGLFLVFTETPRTEAGALGFANRYGFLGLTATEAMSAEAGHKLPADLDGARGESEVGWMMEVFRMAEAVRLWRLVQAEDLAGLAEVIRWDANGEAVYYRPKGAGGEAGEVTIASVRSNRSLLDVAPPGDLIAPARFCVATLINAHRPLSRVSGYMGWDAERRRPALRLGTGSLLEALWLQFALAVDADKRYRQCRECGKWFELSPSVNRTSRQTCSDACRTKGYQRRREEARRLHGEGKSLREIAAAVDSDVSTVKKWVTKRKG